MMSEVTFNEEVVTDVETVEKEEEEEASSNERG